MFTFTIEYTHLVKHINFMILTINSIYFSLKVHSKNEQQKRYRVKDKKEEHATSEFSIDEHTRLLIYKLINNHQLLEEVQGVVSIGKYPLVYIVE